MNQTEMKLYLLGLALDSIVERLEALESPVGGVSQEDYEAVSEERQDLEDQLDAAMSYIEAIETESKDIQSENTRLKAQLELMEDLLSITVHEYKGVSRQLETLRSGQVD